ncbi:hypothetical protein QR98_0069090 [Sarcoptes scabiei]|uniref:Uncharacterized protein n=1 Tax=Sarcoptes scabiei TaxID=52283 RepID=A0A132ABN5_SARSC|nr:hypothetical protein QR98_0069090 [Sarcoptes scabiei]
MNEIGIGLTATYSNFNIDMVCENIGIVVKHLIQPSKNQIFKPLSKGISGRCSIEGVGHVRPFRVTEAGIGGV